MTSNPRAKRHSMYFLSVFDARNGELLGQLSDLSTEGVSILGETPLQCPCPYHLRILIPRSGMPDLRLEFAAESRWTRTEPGPPNASSTTGFRITFLAAEQRKQIQKLVDDFGYAKIGEARATRGTVLGQAAPGGLRRFLRTLFTRR